VVESVYLGLVVYLMWLLVFSRFIIGLNVTVVSVVDVFIDNKEYVVTSSIFISLAFQNSHLVKCVLTYIHRIGVDVRGSVVYSVLQTYQHA